MLQILKKKEHGENIGKFNLKKVEQEILLLAAESHADLILSKKVYLKV